MSSPLQVIFKAFDVFVVVGMAVISFLIFTNVVLRYGFSSGIPFAVEVSRTVLVWVIFMGSVVALAKGAHLGVDSVVVRLPRKARLVCFVVSYGLMLWCCWLLAKGSWALTVIEWGNVRPCRVFPSARTTSRVSLPRSLWLSSFSSIWRARCVAFFPPRGPGWSMSSRCRSCPPRLFRRKHVSGLVFIVSLLGAMGIGVPIAFALMLSGIAMMMMMGNLDAQIMAQKLVNGADSYPLMAIPFFLIAGELMNAGGLSRRIVNVALALVGHIRGGLGYVVIERA